MKSMTLKLLTLVIVVALSIAGGSVAYAHSSQTSSSTTVSGVKLTWKETITHGAEWGGVSTTKTDGTNIDNITAASEGREICFGVVYHNEWYQQNTRFNTWIVTAGGGNDMEPTCPLLDDQLKVLGYHAWEDDDIPETEEVDTHTHPHPNIPV